jgi:hypothetical protein
MSFINLFDPIRIALFCLRPIYGQFGLGSTAKFFQKLSVNDFPGVPETVTGFNRLAIHIPSIHRGCLFLINLDQL